MYILIDRGQMAITHKHRDRNVLGKLSWIECTNSGTILAIGSTRPLNDFTSAELKLIYKNATGAELVGYSNALAGAVMAVARRMPETPAELDEVSAQALLIADGDKSSFRYVYGAMVPEEIDGLFTADPIAVPRVEAEETAAAVGVQYPHTGGASAQNTLVQGTGTPREPRAPSAPRAGGTRDIIFKVADEMWIAKGSPTNIQEVLALRKTIMGELELSYGVKKTTSSTALGDWQKSRLS